ncbi:MAG: DnaJ domain-containing protein [Deltaproteobacteria bacterium]|nr:DnaJ domain-containing protein [Deltaproteobacteria bacterium]
MASSEARALLGIAPRLKDDVDIRTLGLSPHEGFLLSQIDGVTPADVLGDVVAMEEQALVAALTRLENLGAIVWAGARALAAAGPGAATDGAAADPALSEVCDLSPDERARILKADRTFPTLSHWEVLGLSGAPQTVDVKRAYFAASKAYHPDRYFGRDLGSFRERLDRIFRRLKVAYDVLLDEKQRAAYRSKNPPPMKPLVVDLGFKIEGQKPEAAAARPETAEEKAARLEKRRQEIITERRSKRLEQHFKPKAADIDAKSRRAEEMYHHGLSQLKAGQVFAAAASLKLAMAYDPKNSQYAAMFRDATSHSQLERARQLAEAGEAAVAAGNAAGAAAEFAKAFELTPHRVDLAIRAAEQFLAVGNTDAALRYATQAVEVAPNRMEARLTAATVMEKVGDRAGALVHARAATSLDKDDPRAKRVLKRLSS